VPAATTCPVEERDAVTEPLGLLHEVGDQQDRDAALAHLLDQVPGVAAGLGIKAGRHLVEHGEPGPADERQGDRQALLLAAGERAIVVTALVGEPEGFEQLVDVGRVGVERPVQSEDLADLQLGGQGACLQLHAHEQA
jgi:hypothetical protein